MAIDVEHGILELTSIKTAYFCFIVINFVCMSFNQLNIYRSVLSILLTPDAVPMVAVDFTLRPRGLQFLNCTGKENKLIECSTAASQSPLPNCSPMHTVGVSCLQVNCKSLN